MALKGDREYNEITDITNFWLASQATAVEKGGVASVVTQGSGAALGVNITDDPNVVDYEGTVASGTIPKGVLLQDVALAMSTTRDFPNYEKGDEIRPGDKCTLVRHGWIVTDMIGSGETPAVGGIAYLGDDGEFYTSQQNSGPTVGRFETTMDSNGFCRVFIDL